MTPGMYLDGRPTAQMRLDAQDHGVVLPYGDGPDQCDYLGARDMWVFEADGRYHLFYDGAGPQGWRCCHAVSSDLVHWEKRGAVLDLGEGGRREVDVELPERMGLAFTLRFLLKF